jgi:Zn-dependent metalloprotease
MRRTLRQRARYALFYCLAILSPSIVFAQQQNANQYQELIRKDARVQDVLIHPETGTPGLIKLNKSNAVIAQPDELLKSFLQMRAGIDELRPLRTIDNKHNIDVEKKQQYYRGIKVEHGKYSLLKVNGSVSAFSGEFYKIENLNTNANISEQQALESAKRFVGAKEYAWEQLDKLRKTEKNAAKLRLIEQYYNDFYPKGEIVIIKDFFTPGSSALDIAYKFNIYAADPLSRGYVYVNAHTGKIMYYDKIIKHLSPDMKSKASAPASIPEASFILSLSPEMAAKTWEKNFSSTGSSVVTNLPTRYLGVRSAGTKLISGNDPNNGEVLTQSNPSEVYVPGSPTHVLIDDRRGAEMQTYDLNGAGGVPISFAPPYLAAKSFTDVDNNWTLAEHRRQPNMPGNEGENDDFAFDAHWGAGVVYDYWLKIHGRKSFDDNNATIKSYIHSGQAYDNAFWNGSVMTYGDGSYQRGSNNTGFAPLTSVDVCAHEIGHGVCSFTSDLAYQKESGAMNEGFSDIWAACVEKYIIDSIDSKLLAGTGTDSLLNGFKFFSIGEQIDARDATPTAGSPPFVDKPSSAAGSTALRYMNKPSLAGDPDYYFGPHFINPNCQPTLANDQCGVHTNSGVLNRWFYLMVMGGSGRIVTDTSKNKTGAINNDTFNVTGLGFRKAETIAYMVELMLSQNATFLEARNMTIMATEVLYGKCSNEWKTAITAWHAVAVGKSSDTLFCNTAARLSFTAVDTVSEKTAKSDSCGAPSQKVIQLGVTLLPPAKTNPLVITIVPTGTATLNRDYQLQSTVMNYAANEIGFKTNKITVFNDAEIESSETIVLSIHAQETLPGTYSFDTTITIVITDDDEAPAIGAGRRTLLQENFDAVPTGSLPANWISIDNGKTRNRMAWRVGEPGTASAFTSKSVMADLNATPSVEPAYPPDSSVTITLRSPLINATNLADIQVTFTWACLGEPETPGVYLDYGSLKYSFDGINFAPFQFLTNKRYAGSATPQRDTVNLPPQLNNNKFYLAWEWFNDDLFAVPPSFHFDSVKVTAGNRQVESDSTASVVETQYAGTDIYYLSAQDGQVIARITNPSQDLGCVKAKVVQGGSGAHGTLITHNNITYQRTKKVVSIVPQAGALTATYTMTFFVRASDVNGFTPSELKLMKVSDAQNFEGNISSSNGQVLTTTFQDFGAEGYYTYTATTTGFSKFSLVRTVGPLPVNLVSFNASAVNNEYIRVNWTTAQEVGISKYVIERSLAGSNSFTDVGSLQAAGSQNQRSYEFIDRDVKAGVTYQYRLRIVENARSSYSDIRTAKIGGKSFMISIRPNPSDGHLRVDVSGYNGRAELSVMNQAGQIIYMRDELLDDGRQVMIDISNQPRGVYMLRVKTPNEIKVERIVLE